MNSLILAGASLTVAHMAIYQRPIKALAYGATCAVTIAIADYALGNIGFRIAEGITTISFLAEVSSDFNSGRIQIRGLPNWLRYH